MRTGTPLAGAHPAEEYDQAGDDGLDRIELRGLAAHGYHGVHEHERRDGQRFVVDIVAHTDTRPAAADDDLTRTLDYGVLAGQVVAVLTGPPVALLETLAERIAATVLAHPQAVAVDVTVHKPQAPLLGQPDAVSAAVEFADVVVSVRRDRTRVPVVELADPAPRAGWASAAPAPALDARPPDDPAEPIAPLDEGFSVPDLAPSAADFAAEPSVAPYEAADLVAEPPVEDVLAAPVVVPLAEPEGAELLVGETDEPAASEAEPSDQSAWDQSAWAEPMPPSIPPATVTPAPSSAGAVVVTPGLGPVVAPLASGPDAAVPPADEELVPEPVVQAEEPVAGLDVPSYPPPDLAPEPVVPEVAPSAAPSWQAEAAPDHASPDRAVPDPVWVPAPGPHEAPPQAQAAPAVPGWPSDPTAVPVPEAPSWHNQAQPVGTPEPVGAPDPFAAAPFSAAVPFGAAPMVSEPPAAVWPEVPALPDAPAPWPEVSAQSDAPAPWPEVPAPAAQPDVSAPWSGFPAEAVPPAEAAPQPWAAAPVVPPAEPAPPVGEPWGAAPALPGGWAPPPPPQWANLDAPGPTPDHAGQAAPPPPFGASGLPFDAPARPVGLEALDQSPEALTDVVIGVGGNLGPVQETLRWAVLRLGAMTGLEVTAVGPLARTAAVGSLDQPDYLNTVVLARTLLSPRDLLRRLQGVEREAGRERLERWGPRTLDLDIITYGDLVVGDDELTLPHPRAHERAFVLGPWASLDPDAVLPGPAGGPVARLADHAPDAEGVRWMALDWLTDTPGEPGAA